MGIQMKRNLDGTITLRQETQTWNEKGGHMDIEVHSEITLSTEEWLFLVGPLRSMVAGEMDRWLH